MPQPPRTFLEQRVVEVEQREVLDIDHLPVGEVEHVQAVVVRVLRRQRVPDRRRIVDDVQRQSLEIIERERYFIGGGIRFVIVYHVNVARVERYIAGVRRFDGRRYVDDWRYGLAADRWRHWYTRLRRQQRQRTGATAGAGSEDVIGQ